MTEHFFCIHGHFYQPPREDPFTGIIPAETGAEPYANWNERIHSECYHPNAKLGNFERISFNIGPTLFEWMMANYPQTCAQIVQQDQANIRRQGVGNAIAQPYHHTILPLASRKDKETQVYWGMVQFLKRYGRKPDGMWLPETAVDMETLQVLADFRINFTILAPWQAESANLDCTEPYRVKLPDGKNINIFFYHNELSGGISFSPQWTTNADVFLQEQVQPRYDQHKTSRGESQLLLIASDGELYGHHQQFRDYFLAHLTNGASQRNGMECMNLLLWLRQNPPRQTVAIRENTSWSCHHGVLRWKGDCACAPTDGRWKAYLRQACDRLAHDLDEVYIQALKPYRVDPWLLRNRYIYVLLGDITIERLIAEIFGKSLKPESFHTVALLLEAQHQRQRMYTSCGWFYDDFSRIEPKNCLAYAAQAAFLAYKAVGEDLGTPLQGVLRNVISHRTGLRGDIVFNQQLALAYR